MWFLQAGQVRKNQRNAVRPLKQKTRNAVRHWNTITPERELSTAAHAPLSGHSIMLPFSMGYINWLLSIPFVGNLPVPKPSLTKAYAARNWTASNLRAERGFRSLRRCDSMSAGHLGSCLWKPPPFWKRAAGNLLSLRRAVCALQWPAPCRANSSLSAWGKR